MTYQSKSASQPERKLGRSHARQSRKEDEQVYLITGASESVVADSERKNRVYAALIGVRIASLFVVLATDGWVQLAVFVGGMLAPWIGVQIANTIRQVQSRSIQTVPPQQAALEAARGEADDEDNDTVIVGDVVHNQSAAQTAKPSAESSAFAAEFEENERDDDDTRS